MKLRNQQVGIMLLEKLERLVCRRGCVKIQRLCLQMFLYPLEKVGIVVCYDDCLLLDVGHRLLYINARRRFINLPFDTSR